jgi:nitrate reductase NapE component
VSSSAGNRLTLPRWLTWATWALAAVSSIGTYLALLAGGQTWVPLLFTMLPLVPAGFVGTYVVDPTRLAGRRLTRAQRRTMDERIARNPSAAHMTPEVTARTDGFLYLLLTTILVSVAFGVPPTIVGAIVTGDFGFVIWLYGLLLLPMLAFLGWVAGSAIYLFFGLLVVAAIESIMNASARRRADFTRLATGLLLTSGVVFAAAVASTPHVDTDLQRKARATLQIFTALGLFDGGPAAVAWAWVARVSLLVMVAAVVLLILSARRNKRGGRVF